MRSATGRRRRRSSTPSPRRVIVSRRVISSSCTAVDVRDEEPGRVRPEVDRCDARHRLGRKARSQRVRALRVLERSQEHLELRPRHAETLGRGLQILARALGVGEELLRAGRALVEERELARDRAAGALALTPERDAADDDDERADDREHESDQEGGEDHEASLEALLQHPEDTSHDLPSGTSGSNQDLVGSNNGVISVIDAIQMLS